MTKKKPQDFNSNKLKLLIGGGILLPMTAAVVWDGLTTKSFDHILGGALITTGATLLGVTADRWHK